MKKPKCPCCGQSSQLRKLNCMFCDAYVMASRKQIRDGLHPCRCGGQLEPICLQDRARCFPDEKYGRDAWAQYAQRYDRPARTCPSLSHAQGVQVRKLREMCRNKRDASQPVADMPF